MPLTLQLSTYLNLWRFVAAAVVVLGHANLAGIGTFGIGLGKYAHTMVMVFFVMSGFIIARTTIDSRRGARDFILMRATRVYMVAVPAIALSFALSALLGHLAPAAARADVNIYPLDLFHLASSLLFLNESWANPASLSLNIPYWSLCYEVWYYAIFGGFFYLEGARRWLATLALMAMAGPAVMALLPVWLLGVALAVMPSTFRVNVRVAQGLALVAPLLVVWLVEQGWDIRVKNALAATVPGLWRLEYSTRFATDFAIGLLVAAHIYGVSRLGAVRSLQHDHVMRAAKYLAGFSFSLYLFHDPLLRFAHGMGLAVGAGALPMLAVVSGVIFICWLLACVTELKTSKVKSWFTA